MLKSFSFSYSLDEIEEISYNENISVEESEEIVIKLMKSDQIYVGERTEGSVEFDDSETPIVYKVDYQYCSEVGEDWNDDVWEELEVEVQLYQEPSPKGGGFLLSTDFILISSECCLANATQYPLINRSDEKKFL